MLAITGRLADGWVPSASYAPPYQLGTMIKVIKESAEMAERDPEEIQLWYNVGGNFSSRNGGFLAGPANEWVKQLTELAVELRLNAFLFGPGEQPESDLRRFAEEVVPAVRDAVEAERGINVPLARHAPPAVQVILGTTDHRSDNVRHFDHSDRPRVPKQLDAPTTAIGRASAKFLVELHDHLRHELSEVRTAIGQLAIGQVEPGAVRSLINEMSMRQNYWSIGSFCTSYCRLLTLHHTIEDEQMFVNLEKSDQTLAPVLERLGEEHEVIAGTLVRLDKALVAMLADPAEISAVHEELERLSDQLLSHLSYEEEELLEPLARSSIRI